MSFERLNYRCMLFIILLGLFRLILADVTTTSMVSWDTTMRKEDDQSYGMISYTDSVSKQLLLIKDHWDQFGGDMRLITNRHYGEGKDSSNWSGNIVEYKEQPWKILGSLSPEQEQYNEAEVYKKVVSGEAPYSWYLEYQYFAATSGNVDSMQQYIDGWMNPLKSQIEEWQNMHRSYVIYINNLDDIKKGEEIQTWNQSISSIEKESKVSEEHHSYGSKQDDNQRSENNFPDVKSLIYYHPNFENALPFKIIMHTLISQGNIEKLVQILDTKMIDLQKEKDTSPYCNTSTHEDKKENMCKMRRKDDQDNQERRETDQKTLLQEELEEDIEDGSYRSILLDQNYNLSDGTSPILTAVLFEQVAMLRWLIKSLQKSRNYQKSDLYSSVDYSAGPGLSPLIMAAVLDKKGSTVSDKDTDTMVSPSSENDLPMLKLLLDNGGREQICSYRHRFTGASIFHFAAEMNQGDAIALLCKEQFLIYQDMNRTLPFSTNKGEELACDHLPKTQNIIPLHVAADIFTYSETSGITSTASALLALLSPPCASKEYINSLLLGDTTPLYLASQKGNLEAVKILISRGADVNYVMPMGTYSGAVAKLEHSQQNMANFKTINSEVANGATALHAAAEEGHFEVVRALLLEGKAKFLPSMSGVNPLGIAVMYEQQDIITLMLMYLLDYYQSKEDKIQALQKRANISTEDMAKAVVQMKKVRRSIERIINNREPSTRITPFLDCILRNGPKRSRRKSKIHTNESPKEFKLDRAIATFLKFQSLTGINVVDTVDRRGRSPLSIAISRSDTSLVKLLIEHGARVTEEEKKVLLS